VIPREKEGPSIVGLTDEEVRFVEVGCGERCTRGVRPAAFTHTSVEGEGGTLDFSKFENSCES
jgi:hypothetical protein